MEKEIIKEKLQHYENLLMELNNTNVEEKVKEKIQPIMEEIRAQVISELKDDVIKCKHYIEVLKELDNDIAKEEENIPTLENEEKEVTLEDEIKVEEEVL